MQVSSAYVLVVLVWSTTPLAIHLSNSTLSFVSAITARVVIALAICLFLLKLFKQPLITQRRDWLLYAASGFGLFPNMLLIYWAAQSIPSGLMSVLMGIYPFFVGFFSMVVLKQNPFNSTRVIALILAVCGLAIIQREQMSISAEAVKGVLVLVVACAVWGISTVLVKKLGAEVSPLRQGTGSLLFSTPFFLITWALLDGQVPKLGELDQASIGGVAYLVLMGSVVSHTLWYYVLKECKAMSVSLVTLITPVLAMSWGWLFAGEALSTATIVGATTIVVALMLYQGVLPYLWRQLVRIYSKLSLLKDHACRQYQP